ncbi:DNA alkylation repair protein [Bacteroides sp.]|uniref:DNA alkylation repair protein n=1 Tax=Bacteroides sp. TaxID=29523 RepID=UPI0026206813|nr:DNA alkylation repair protein [Bacteroides sp.]MDD3039819.1 DNA alkylation repair protein [Bacteroides sp.]
MVTSENIRKELNALADAKYKEFHSSLLPGTENVLGVRIPQLRTIAKRIAKQNDWYPFINATEVDYYEETMLQGMIIGLAKIEFEEQMNYVKMFIPRIDNWAVCDIFCGELKTLVKKGKDKVWQFIQPYLYSDKEFEKRFGIVMLFHYINEEYIDRLLEYADLFQHEAYYARMAMAWMLSTCFVKFPDKTLEYLKQSQLDTWTYNKALQKTVESLRVDKKTKLLIKSMKRKD